MPAVSRAQQAFFAIALHHPERLRRARPSMTAAQMREFAETPTADLPRRVRRKAPSRGRGPGLRRRSGVSSF